MLSIEWDEQKKASSKNSQNIQNECNNMSQSTRDNPDPSFIRKDKRLSIRGR